MRPCGERTGVNPEKAVHTQVIPQLAGGSAQRRGETDGFASTRRAILRRFRRFGGRAPAADHNLPSSLRGWYRGGARCPACSRGLGHQVRFGLACLAGTLGGNVQKGHNPVQQDAADAGLPLPLGAAENPYYVRRSERAAKVLWLRRSRARRIRIFYHAPGWCGLIVGVTWWSGLRWCPHPRGSRRTPRSARN